MRQQENHDDHNNLRNAVGCLPMLPVCLRHAADDFSENENAIHFVTLYRVPWRVAFVVRDYQELVFHFLKALHVCSLIVQEGINSIAVEAIHADIDKQQIARLNRPRHAVATNVDDPDVLSLTPIKHVACFSWRVLN